MDTDKTLLTTSEAAKLCGISLSTLSRAIRNGQIKVFSTPGGHHRIRKEDLSSFVSKMGLPGEGSPGPVRKILVIEDNQAEMETYRKLLERDPNLEVKAIPSGFEAGFLLQAFRPHAVVLDIYLKDMDGREIIKMIRKDPNLQTCKIAVVSGSKEPAETADIQAHPIDLFLQKPVLPADFTEKIKKLL